MDTQWLLNWWNLIFILPFGLGLLYLGLYTVSGWTFGEADADAGVDHDLDAHLDAQGHIAFEHDSDMSHDAGDGHDAEGHDGDHGDGNASSLMAMLAWLGVGRVPLSLILMVLMLCWGAIGFAVNHAMMGTALGRAVPLAIFSAFAGSVLLTKLVSSAVARFLPLSETYARRRHELLGTVCEALYPIDSSFGMACGRDDSGEPFQVACRVEKGHSPLAKGTPIQLVAYTADERMFYVIPATVEQKSN